MQYYVLFLKVTPLWSQSVAEETVSCRCVTSECVRSGRVVNVSSMSGQRALKQCSPELQQRFRSDDITDEELVGLMRRFIAETKKGKHKEDGWPDTAYGVSKTGVTVRAGV